MTAIAILAGGQSSRMGTDKAQLTIEHQTLLERTARLADEFSSHLAIIGRESPDDWPHDLSVAFVPDEVQNAGPLAGLVSALRWAQSQDCEEVLLLPCDLPQLNADALGWILTQPRGKMGVASVRVGQIEPLFAIYAVQVLAPARERLENGRRSLHGLIEVLNERGEFDLAELPTEFSAALFNCNTPDDWRRATGQ